VGAVRGRNRAATDVFARAAGAGSSQIFRFGSGCTICAPIMSETNLSPAGADAASTAAGLMPIPGHVDPMTVPRPTLVEGVTPREDGRTDLVGLPRKRIAELFEGAGLDAKAAKLRAKQVFHWLYHRGVTEFDAMTDIAKTMRPWLAERFVIGRPTIVEAQHSSDGTRKWLLRTADGHDFEMVFIPDADRGTLCGASRRWPVSKTTRTKGPTRPMAACSPTS